MRRLRDIALHPAVGTYGARIADDEEPQPVGSVLPAATHELYAWASGFWPEVDPDDYEWGVGKMRVRHKESGELLRIRTGLPGPGGEHASGVAVFCVRDGRLVLLANREDRPTFQAVLATYGGREIKPSHEAPLDGEIF